MNLLHLKYALEVEKTRSINKAAENLIYWAAYFEQKHKKAGGGFGLYPFYTHAFGYYAHG